MARKKVEAPNSDSPNFADIEYYTGESPLVESTNIDADSLGLKEQEAKRYIQDTEERKLLSHWVIWVVSLWLSAVLFVVMFNNLLCFNLNNSVLITLLATTTVNILGLAYIVLQGLFGNKKRKKNRV